MKILHILSQAPDFTGSGKFIQEILKNAKLNGHENFLIAGVQSNFNLDKSIIAKENCIPIRFDGKDMACAIPGMSDAMPYKSTIFSTLSNTEIEDYESVFEKKILQAIDLFNPDIIHTHHLWIATSMAVKAAPNIPVVTTCHGTCLRQFYLCPHIGKRVTKSFKKIDRIMALSNFQKLQIVKIHSIDPDRIDIIPGGFNSEVFFSGKKTIKDRVEILYAGKLSNAKGVPWLLNTLLKIKGSPFRLHIAGDSSTDEKQLCLDLAAKLGDKAVYHGPLSHEELGKMMRKSHIFILPSFYEGFPLVLMEALACGCRIITTSLDGAKEVLGSIESDMIKMIDLPKLETIDIPFEKDMPSLQASLAETIKAMIQDVFSNTNPNSKAIDDLISEYTWEKLFK
ncbi:MAG: glycosyltransferase family 4 protein, partial [Desulfobacteraceae bacterium]|nr:glycosyltransferase family 4 protein [Desulfobacteraceae bacterium]